MLSTATSTKALPISIHALRKESDYSVIVHKVDTIHFYPRSPNGERPQLDMDSVVALAISIHALRVESDCVPLSIF